MKLLEHSQSMQAENRGDKGDGSPFRVAATVPSQPQELMPRRRAHALSQVVVPRSRAPLGTAPARGSCLDSALSRSAPEVAPRQTWSLLSVLCRSLWACEGDTGSLGPRPKWGGAEGPSPPTPLPHGGEGRRFACGALRFTWRFPRALALDVDTLAPSPLADFGEHSRAGEGLRVRGLRVPHGVWIWCRSGASGKCGPERELGTEARRKDSHEN